MNALDYKNQEIKRLGDELTHLEWELDESKLVISRLENTINFLDKQNEHIKECLNNALEYIWEHVGYCSCDEEEDEEYLFICKEVIGLNEDEMKKEQSELDSR